ncbi:acetoin utilization deacetylase AcuC-like enzyme [Halomonas ventosae]|uniref:Acetoin utilization deacetylase AcuC-like enzyme n=1 Tax=Halomonas ventosae TaxID=229007 RepID=A0A4V3DPN6_9GAMM|nr:histone deacetylase [Halomonas ventosae]TDR52996.1 acetoin utilization deacetylase AcuC-like enzyme [Halomonas ventosae]
MAEQNSVIAFYDERMLAHEPNIEVPFLPGRIDKRVRSLLSGLGVPWKYPEHPARLTAIRQLLDLEPLPGVTFEAGMVATREQLARVHTLSYLDSIYQLRGKNAWLDVDTTAVSPGSLEAAEIAAGTAIAAVEAVVEGRAESSFALVRPPGHHAEPVRARGFCLFNNVAVAAAHARAVLGCQRVLIIDWDAHHGNGTQDIFWADPDVLFFDIHRASPFYPGTGNLEEVGVGLGDGAIINVPLPADAGDAAYLKAFHEILVPAAEWFRPDLILVSAGFDPHSHDLALNVSYDGFSAMTGILQSLARRQCGGRLVFVLEGGYNLISLSRGVRSVLKVLAGDEPPEPGQRGLAEVEAAAAFHRSAFVAEEDTPSTPTDAGPDEPSGTP